MTSPTAELAGSQAPAVRNLTIGRLATMLSGLPLEQTDRVRDDNLAFVTDIGGPARMIQLIDDILTHEEDLVTIAARSYRHVNHFDKIVLVDSVDRRGYRLTLHLWDPPYTESEINDELIHDHRFSFWSTILVGTLVSENFEPSPSGRPYRQYTYLPEKVADGATASNFYEFVSQTGLVQLAESVERSGNSYYLAYHRTHRVVLPRDAMTCTLVLRGPRERERSNVFNTAYPTQSTRMTNVMFTPQQVRAKLLRLRQTLVQKRLGSPSSDD